MQQKHLKRKGLTLLEVIISIAVYAVLALLLAEIMTLVNSTIRSTEQLNNRLSHEAYYADNLQTKDDDHNFASKTVGVTIQYAVNSVTRAGGAGTQVIAVDSEKTLDTNKGVSLTADEYTADYNEESPGTHYHDNTNYRFMRFDKKGLDPSQPCQLFIFRLWLNIPQSVADQIDHLTIEGKLASNGVGRTSDQIKMEDFRTDSNGWLYYDIALSAAHAENEDPQPGKKAVYDTVNVKFFRPTALAESNNEVLDLSIADDKDIYDEITVEYPLKQVQGSETNYYKGYNIVYSNHQVKTPTELTRAEREDHNIPEVMEVNYTK